MGGMSHARETLSAVELNAFCIGSIFKIIILLRYKMSNIVKFYVLIHTETDDKDREEEVTIQIFHGKRVYAETKVGGGDVWNDQTDQPFTLDSKRGFPEEDSEKGKLRISKGCHGSPTGCGWDMSVEVYGIAEDGVQSELLRRTNIARMGDSNPTVREWPFQKIDE